MKFIKTEKAPQAIGPYSQGTIINNTVFVSGQIPLNPETGVLETDVEKATLRSLTNVLAIVEGAGSSLDKIAKVNVFVRDINDFEKINAVYDHFFKGHKPARALVEVSNLPKNSILEIEAIAEL